MAPSANTTRVLGWKSKGCISSKSNLTLAKVSGGKPPFPTCKLLVVEWDGSARANLQVGKGGLPPLSYPTYNYGSSQYSFVIKILSNSSPLRPCARRSRR